LTQLLVLFDVDGTLLLTDDPLAGAALRETVEIRFGVELPGDAIEHVDHRGQTALRIGRLVLRDAGLEDDEIDERLGAWCREFGAHYVALLADADTTGWHVAPGARTVLVRLARAGHRLALLTGNPEPMARARMERLGLERFFQAGQGAFGCDAESRTELIELARARAGGWPREATVAVGDTERDATSAGGAGIHYVGVGATGLAAAAAPLLGRSA
jgi:phosphoglycolate phosphatase